MVTTNSQEIATVLYLASTLHDLALLQQSSGLVEEAARSWAQARQILDACSEQV